MKIVLLITLKCNQKCLFCNVNKGNIFITLKILEKFLKDKLKKYKGIDKKYIKIHISGGEPTIHPDFFEILDMILNYSNDIEIQTNGIFFGLDKNKNKLRKYKGLNFYISFHSHIEEIYNKITVTNGQYYLAIKGIKNILSYLNKGHAVLNIVINKYNVDSLIDYLIFTRKHFNDLPLNITILRIENDTGENSDLIIKYFDFVDMIDKNINFIDENNFRNILSMNGGICDLPLCSIKENKNFIINNKYFHRNFNKKTHRKMKKCESCIFNNKCPGIMKSYLDKFGESEFFPLKNN